MRSFEPTGLTEVPISREVVLQLLSHIPQDLILVGGQALAFWIEQYQVNPFPQSSKDEAFVSMDADFNDSMTSDTAYLGGMIICKWTWSLSVPVDRKSVV